MSFDRSQPLAGMTRTRCAADENLLEQIRLCSAGETLHILDARPKTNAMTNQVIKGMGYENEAYYTNCKVEFLNVPNIHVMRDSLNKLHSLCHSSDEDRWLIRLDNSKWLEHLRTIMQGVIRVTSLIEGGFSVLLHCSVIHFGTFLTFRMDGIELLS